MVNSLGCDSMIILNLTINEFQTNFSESSNSFLAPPFSVYFSNNTPDLTNYSFTWDFGDGTVVQDNSDSVFYEYLYNGNYDVTLVVEDIINGCGFDTLKKTGIISCSGGPNLSIIEKYQSISLFPNPTNENIKITIDNFNGNIHTEVYDLIGNKLSSFENNSISLKDFSSGIYLLKISYDKRVREFKVIKE
jgi:PKD repeat protein